MSQPAYLKAQLVWAYEMRHLPKPMPWRRIGRALGVSPGAICLAVHRATRKGIRHLA